MFQCLVIRISLVTICYVHARARYIFLSHDSQAWTPGHVRGVRAGFSNIPRVPSADSLVSFYRYCSAQWGNEWLCGVITTAVESGPEVKGDVWSIL